MKDRNGWPIQVDARIRLYTKEGARLKQQGVVVKVREDGIIEFHELRNLNLGFTRGERCEVMGGDPRKLKRYKAELGIVKEASERLRRMRRVTSI